MEIPDKVLDSILIAMADYECDYETDLGEIGSHETEAKVRPSPSKPKETRKRKSFAVLSNPTTVLFSTDGKHRAIIYPLLDDFSDGYSYKLDVTGRIYASLSPAVRSARKWLRKKRIKYYNKHPDKRPRIKTVRLYPKETRVKQKSIQKLYKMDKETANILFRMSEKKLKIYADYSRKKFDNNKTTAISGSTTDFNLAICKTLKEGTKKERKLVAKMLTKFTHEPFRNTNMFY